MVILSRSHRAVEVYSVTRHSKSYKHIAVSGFRFNKSLTGTKLSSFLGSINFSQCSAHANGFSAASSKTILAERGEETVAASFVQSNQVVTKTRSVCIAVVVRWIITRL